MTTRISTLSATAAFLLLAQYSLASVTIQFSARSIRQADGSIASIGSKGILVADTGSDGFIGDYINSSINLSGFNNTNLSVGQTIGGASNDEIVGIFDLTDFGGGGGGFNDEINFDLGSVAVGQELALYWFPTVSTNLISGSLSQYGFFRSDDPDTGADIGFFVQGDGSNNILAAIDSTFDSTPPSPTQLTAVPEPSAYAALAGFCVLGWGMLRRRRA